MKVSFGIILALGLLGGSSSEAAEWMIAGREQMCLPVSILAKRGADLRDVQSPYDLADKMRAAGHQTEIKEYKAGSRPAVEVRVPSRNLDVMFVRAELCGKNAAPKR